MNLIYWNIVVRWFYNMGSQMPFNGINECQTGGPSYIFKWGSTLIMGPPPSPHLHGFWDRYSNMQINEKLDVYVGYTAL